MPSTPEWYGGLLVLTLNFKKPTKRNHMRAREPGDLSITRNYMPWKQSLYGYSSGICNCPVLLKAHCIHVIVVLVDLWDMKFFINFLITF